MSLCLLDNLSGVDNIDKDNSSLTSFIHWTQRSFLKRNVISLKIKSSLHGKIFYKVVKIVALEYN